MECTRVRRTAYRRGSELTLLSSTKSASQVNEARERP